MRKTLLTAAPALATQLTDTWLDLKRLARAELTSEDPANPLENAFCPGDEAWRAGTPGAQMLRLHFDEPLRLRAIHLIFIEHEVSRTQDFVLRWRSQTDAAWREIVRQQFTFSPPGTTREIETYQVDLVEVAALELHLVPDLSGHAIASLAEFRLA